MSSKTPWLLVVTMLFGLVAGGCGGSSGGSGSTGGTGSQTAVNFSFSGGTPTVVAVQIGSGTFTTEALTGNTLRLSLPSGTSTFAVAFVCGPLVSGPAQLSQMFVFELSTSDGTSFTAPCATGAASGQTGSLTGSVDASAIAGATYLNIDSQNGKQSQIGSPSGISTSFNVAAPAGSDRVEVLAFNSSLQGLSETVTLLAAKNYMNQTVPGALNGGAPVVFGASDQTTTAPITYAGVPSGFSAPSTLVSFDVAEGGGFLIAEGATNQYPELPASAVESGDTYSFLATAQNASAPGQMVMASLLQTAAGPVSLVFPAPWSYSGPTPSSSPTFTFEYSGSAGKAGVLYSAGLSWFTAPATENFVELIATANYQSGSASLSYPDLSGLPGFTPSPVSGTQVSWIAEILQNSYGFLQSTPPGATATAVENSGNFTVP